MAGREPSNLCQAASRLDSAQNDRGGEKCGLVSEMNNLGEEFDRLDSENESYLGEQEAKVLRRHEHLLLEHTRLMKEEYRIGAIPEARRALGDVWLQLTGGVFDPGGLMAPGGSMDLGDPSKR